MSNRANYALALAAAGMLAVATAPAAEAATVVPSPLVFDFGDVVVGNVSSPFSQIFEFSPSGATSPPLVSSPTPLGQFSWDFDGACNNVSCAIAFFFSPNALGPFSTVGTIRFRFSTTDIRNATVNFTGVGVVPVPAALPLFLTGLGGLAYMSRRRKPA
jgi:hypothetical protein